MATVCFQSTTPGHRMIPMPARRRMLPGQTMPWWGSNGQTMLPGLANLCVKPHSFRSQLDRRLCERDHQPVRWHVDLPRGNQAA